MRERVLIILLILNLFYLISNHNKMKDLETKVNVLSFKKISQSEAEVQTKVIAKEMKTKAQSVLSIRCQDSSKAPSKPDKNSKTKYPRKWFGTAAKISEQLVLTAEHLVSASDSKDRVLPISCELFQRGVKVGTFNTEKNKMVNIGKRDIVLLQSSFNEEGKKLPSLEPKIYNIAAGENLVLITHPKNMINDYLITFGMVINDDASHLLGEKRKEYWKNSIITNMTAAPGSSGSPLFTLDGQYIGIHVGGERDDGLNTNYQVLFDGEFFLIYQMTRLLQ